ncbi:extracellular solute-binding protein [Pseudobacteriovorax antillogorgiicola]|uniref:extracellular solute-binding protein n=1 Tax=Pseudobacteriovorax antillogorgiicola TaxID=1513793 RepID=UPI0013565076|nr:extracellular solute-binding protein [Pseudobacteriovorax antillogorgiicola]
MKTLLSLACCLLLGGTPELAISQGVDKLPSDLKWQTNEVTPLIASPNAKKGGTLVDSMLTFPLTLRQVGPDSNGGFRAMMDNNDMGMVTIHPNTDKFLPELATHWAFDKNGKTAYYKLNSAARWSDKKPVTADDFVYTLEFYRSEHIVHPWYNQYYTDQIEAIQKFKAKDGKDVVAITLPKPKPDMLYYTNITPVPKHFYKLDKNFVQNYNWKVKPNSGPYYIDKVKKGKSITFRRKKDWWAQDLPWFKNRFNIDKITLKVIRDQNVNFEYLKKGKIDYMSIPFPDYWHDKSKTKEFDYGYIHKLMAYNDRPRSDYVLTLNEAFDFFKDQKVREAFHYSMNVDKVIQQVLRGDYNRLQGISRGYGEYTNLKVKARPFDLKKADELLDAAGWKTRNAQGIRTKDGKTLSTTITYSQANIAPRLVVLREEAKKSGIELKLKLLDGAAMWKSFLEKKHEIAFVSWGPRYRPQYYGQYHSSNAGIPQTNNFSNTADPELDKLIEGYRASIDEKERVDLAHKIQQRVHDLAIQIPLFEVPYYRLAYWAWIQFPKVPGTKTTYYFDYFGTSSGGLMWIDKELKKKVETAKRKGQKLPPVTRIDETFKIKL